MAISEESRHRMYGRLEEVLGREEAAVLMEHLPPVGWADVATKRDIDRLSGDIDRLNIDIERLGAATKREIEHLSEVFDARLTARIAQSTADTRASMRTLFLGLVALQMSGAGLAISVMRLA